MMTEVVWMYGVHVVEGREFTVLSIINIFRSLCLYVVMYIAYSGKTKRNTQKLSVACCNCSLLFVMFIVTENASC